MESCSWVPWLFLLDSSALLVAAFRTSSNNMVVLSIQNYIGGNFQAPLPNDDDDTAEGTQQLQFLPVTNPATDEIIGQLGLSSSRDVEAACQAASAAWLHWSGWTIKARAAVLLKFHALIEEHAQELADLIVQENGKNKTEVSLEILLLV